MNALLMMKAVVSVEPLVGPALLGCMSSYHNSGVRHHRSENPKNSQIRRLLHSKLAFQRKDDLQLEIIRRGCGYRVSVVCAMDVRRQGCCCLADHVRSHYSVKCGFVMLLTNHLATQFSSAFILLSHLGTCNNE